MFKWLLCWIFGIVYLPTTPEQFDSLVAKVVKKYKLSDSHHAAAIISVAIRHLPNEQATTKLKYLGHSVLKNLANYVAYHKAETMKHDSQIDQLVSLLRTDPNDQQAMDALTKAATDGSEKAKEAIAKFEPKLTVVKDQDADVIPIQPASQET